MSKAKKFSCMYCGTPFEVYPPYDYHPTASLDEPKEADVQETIKEMTYDSKNKDCLKPTTLCWYRREMHMAIA